MGRPSKLTDKQWSELEKRLLAGEKASDLAKEYGVSPTAISRRVSQDVAKVKDVANQIVATDLALKALPVTQQVLAISLADELKAISMHLAGAGKYGAATAHRLSGIAHAKVQEIDDAAPLNTESFETLKGVAILTKMANESSMIGMNLLAANKEMVKGLQQEQEVLPVKVTIQVEDASIPEPTAE